MAILGDKNGIYAEVKYDRYKDGWIYYNFGFFLNEKSFFNPDIMWGKNRIECEATSEHLIEYLEKSLQEKMDYVWFPEEPDINVGVQPSQYEKDSFEVDFNPRSYKFELPKKQDGIYGDGEPIIRMSVSREKLEKFISDLKSENKDFLEKNKEEIENYEKAFNQIGKIQRNSE